jgi:competence protein ComEA
MIDDPAQTPRRRVPPDEPGWGDPFAAFSTLADPGADPGADPDTGAWRIGTEMGPTGLGDAGDLRAGPPSDPGSAAADDVSPAPLRSGRRPLLIGLLRPWFEPRPGELRGAIVLLALALAVSLALWFDASRRPSLDGWPPSAGTSAPAASSPQALAGAPGAVGELRPGSVDGSDGWGLTTGGATQRGPVVHVSGAVHDPGVVTLPDGSRVADAIAASGGAMPDARLDRLNLARRVEDGERVHVPRVGEDAPPPEEPASRGVLPDGRIDLNNASQAELETLPGVGPARAQAIIAERTTRPFRVPGDLRRVPGIGEATFQRLAPLVAVR